MPRHNNTLAASRLREWMGAKGPAGIDTVSPEIVPVILAADLSGQDPGARFTKYCMGYVLQNAAASNYSHVQLFNPATSTVDLILDKVDYLFGTTGFGHVRIHNVALTTQSANVSVIDVPGEDVFVWDGGVASMIGQVRSVNHTSLYGSTYIKGIYGSSSILFPLPLRIRIPPGRGIVISPSTANVTFRASFEWREINRVP